jgi:putative Mg2+ transporter-C (MgtC) family protein
VVQSLHSEDPPSGTQLEVRADLIPSPSNHLQLEKIVSRVSLEKGVSAARWAVLNAMDI